MIKDCKDMSMLEERGNNIVLFRPHIPEKAIEYVTEVLHSRWIGQGPKVDIFEKKFSEMFAGSNPSVAVGAGTDALHLAYILADIKEGDEVIAPVFTCTATNIPLMYQKAVIKFADIQQYSLNIDPQHVKKLITKKTKAIVCVHYGGYPCDMTELQQIADEYQIPIIEDAAQAIGGEYKNKKIGSISEFSCFSFQAIKTITTADGGLLTLKNQELLEKAKRIRWFGIDRSAKQNGVWENDIYEVGYKYQMTDVGAAMGLASLEDFDNTLAYRRKLLQKYYKLLKNTPDLKIVGQQLSDRKHAAWLMTVLVENKEALQSKLRENNIESNQVHFRNDRYSVFKDFKGHFPNMDAVEDKYLVLPLHMHVSEKDVEKICEIINSGW